MRELREPSSANEVADFETGALAGFVLARASAGLADSHYPQRHRAPGADPGWFGRPLWEMRPEDADAQVPDRLLPATPLTGAPQGWWLPDGVP
ncbi:MAG: hypothetical protein ABSB59_32830 [Streptosporangiaceae bacterium]|jgi:hypothetical protein